MKIDKVNEGYQDGTLPVEGQMFRPVHISCAESCTDEEFGGYFASESAAMKAARKHPHATQLRNVSIEEYRDGLEL